MKTRWTDAVNIESPLGEYPRPQLKRYLWTNLNGQYEFTINENFEEIPENFELDITVPFAVETPLSGVERKVMPGEILWYRRKFSLDKEYEDKKVILHFGAVDWECKVFINSQMVGGHTGGYIPFSFDITPYLNGDENELVVGVFDPTDKHFGQRGKQVLEPDSIFYTATSGIWQTVWIEGVNEYFVNALKITPDIDNLSISLNIDTNIEKTDRKIVATVFDDDENELFCGEINDVDIIKFDKIKLWSPEEPNLYNLMLEVYVDDVLYDTVVSYFGMRKFSLGRDENGILRLLLNNKVYFQTGVLDQGYWPDGGMTAPCDDALVFDIRVMKSLGFNMLRKHIKIEPLRWYYHCDRLGMIVWQDMMSGDSYFGDNSDRPIDASRQMFEEELEQMLYTLYNCVSICTWVPFNEGWGQFDAKRISEKIKQIDSTRLVDHASGWHDEKGGDMLSIHCYEQKINMPSIEEKRTFVISEYGGLGRTMQEHSFSDKKPFVYKMYKSKEALTKGYEKLVETQIVPKVKKGLSAVVYTQLSDVEAEVNGVMTYDRDIIKIDAETVQRLNRRLISIILR